MTDLTNKKMDEAVHCFYNETDNLWCEYKYSFEIGMYEYEIYGDEGFQYRGFIGVAAIAPKGAEWYSLGTL